MLRWMWMILFAFVWQVMGCKSGVVQDSTSSPTCAEQQGNTCAQNQDCLGNWVSASDTDRCCSAECTDPTQSCSGACYSNTCSSYSNCSTASGECADNQYCCLGSCTNPDNPNPGSYYIAPDGNDENDGSIDAPWATLLYAVRQVGPGDTLMLRGGDYNIPDNSWTRGDRGDGGAPGNYLTIKNFPGEEPVLIRETTWRMEAPYVIIEGLKFVNHGIGFGDSYGVAHHSILRNNEFTGTGFRYSAISVKGHDNLIEGNYIHDLTQGTSLDHGIYVHTGRGDKPETGKNNIIRNNFIADASCWGIHIYDEKKANDEPDNYRILDGLVVENNTMTRNNCGGIIVATGTNGLPLIKNVLLRNNLIYDCGTRGIALRHNLENIQIYNNTIYNSPDYGMRIAGCCGSSLVDKHIQDIYISNNIIHIQSGAMHVQRGNSSPIENLVIDNNFYWPAPLNLTSSLNDAGAVVADPQFVDPANNDYHLLFDSLAKDSGLSLAEVPEDKDGVLRPQGNGYDMGAYEYTD